MTALEVVESTMFGTVSIDIVHVKRSTCKRHSLGAYLGELVATPTIITG
jgi:hypothetical protein